ncbi:MAG TPA: YebC/PmpR family DNA-binding transcriptional regulator [Polyangia bacterium]|jgi:YebC/PmpR family DNA-binding regulatory protein|nr:YebC/PmpR family DNA-binding transcriptional regulator [Polyangia bacterium]
MGRIFETRKATMFKRWDKMAKLFTRFGKDIAIAVKSGGPSPDINPSLRRILHNARVANMPRDKIENAIKKASGQGAESYDIVIYEGYAAHGIAIIVETATNNPTRTVANVRSAFKTYGGSIGTEGSVAFQFKKMGVFRLAPDALAGKNAEEIELELIDHGLEEMGEGTSDKGEPQTIIRGSFADFGKLQAAIEARGIAVLSAESEYVAQNLLTLPDDKSTEVLELVDALEQDEDVQRVFHNLG